MRIQLVPLNKCLHKAVLHVHLCECLYITTAILTCQIPNHTGQAKTLQPQPHIQVCMYVHWVCMGDDQVPATIWQTADTG